MISSTDEPDLGAPFETIPADETGNIDETATLGASLQDKRAGRDESQDGKVLRGVHAKSHGCVKAKFTIRDDIEKCYRVGLFAHPGKVHDAWIRFSNAAVLREDDLKANDQGIRQNGSRGMAIKVMDVDGEMLVKDDGRCNQDFLMINTPAFAFANVRDYLRLQRILARDALGADPKAYFFPAVLAQLGEPKDGEPAEITGKRQFLRNIVAADPLLSDLSNEELQGTIASAKVAALITAKAVRNPMQIQYFGAAPFLFGPDRVMKFSVAPVLATEQLPFEDITSDAPSKDYLHEALARTMSCSVDICFNFMIQTRKTDGDNLNIENATTLWPGEDNGYVTVATITIEAPQEVHAPHELEHCEKLAFNPWHSLAAHQPLGGINRLRRKVYVDSAQHRKAQGY